MAGKWHNKQCPVCFKGTLRDSQREKFVEYRGRIYNYTAKGAFCDHCDDGMSYHDEQEEAAWVSFRDAVDAEEAAELARIRKKLKLTQREAAKIAGGGTMPFPGTSGERSNQGKPFSICSGSWTTTLICLKR